MYGQDILCGIPKGTFEIPHKISYLYIERDDFLFIIENLTAPRWLVNVFETPRVSDDCVPGSEGTAIVSNSDIPPSKRVPDRHQRRPIRSMVRWQKT